MQARQVSIDGQPVKFGGVGPAAAAADIISLTQKKIAHAGDVVAHQVGDDPRFAQRG
jgi:2-methylcitrate dehydratase PrpD